MVTFPRHCDLQLAVRGNLRFFDNWELLVEDRVLDMADFNERRSGALAALLRYVGDPLKIGLGSIRRFLG